MLISTSSIRSSLGWNQCCTCSIGQPSFFLNKWCITTFKSKPNISLYDEANVSLNLFYNLIYSMASSRVNKACKFWFGPFLEHRLYNFGIFFNGVPLPMQGDVIRWQHTPSIVILVNLSLCEHHFSDASSSVKYSCIVEMLIVHINSY